MAPAFRAAGKADERSDRRLPRPRSLSTQIFGTADFSRDTVGRGAGAGSRRVRFGLEGGVAELVGITGVGASLELARGSGGFVGDNAERDSATPRGLGVVRRAGRTADLGAGWIGRQEEAYGFSFRLGIVGATGTDRIGLGAGAVGVGTRVQED